MAKLTAAVEQNNSLLCIGLDPDTSKLPTSYKTSSQPLYDFCKVIVDQTTDLAAAFKPNSAFFEAAGDSGIAQLQQLIDYIIKAYPAVPVLLDSKRADIGNTNNGYITFAYDYLQADAITLHPYLGAEALRPLLNRADKGAIILCRTSNPGSGELQNLDVGGQPLYQVVAGKIANDWNTNNNCMLVVGATYPDELAEVRAIIGPEMYVLVPGIGAQGGDLQKTLAAGLNSQGTGLLINSSRGIMYADDPRKAALELHDQINTIRSTYGNRN